MRLLYKDLVSVINFKSKHRLPWARPIFTGEKSWTFGLRSFSEAFLVFFPKMIIWVFRLKTREERGGGLPKGERVVLDEFFGYCLSVPTTALSRCA